LTQGAAISSNGIADESPKIFKRVSARIDRMKRRILKMLSEKGVLADPEAIDRLMGAPDPVKCVDIILKDFENRPLVLTEADVENYMSCDARKPPTRTRRPEKASEEPKHDDVGENSKIVVLKDITGNSTCVGNVIDFAKLFNDRFTSIKRMLVKRRELSGLMPIAKAKKVQRDTKFVGIINDAHMTKNGHTIIELEDEEDKIQVLVMKGPKRAGESFVKDEIIGVVGSFSKDGEIVIAKEIVRPEVPLNSRMEPNGSNSVLAFVSDTHIGSAEFLSDAWNRFVDWLNKDPLANDIKYIVMPGDLVDGIGIYPGQEDELLIEDVYEQYTEFAKLVGQIPKRIRIVMMPGNHDAVRLAEPQPALPTEIASMFDERVMFVGNPCYLEIEGRTILAYHGRSMDDFIANIRNLSYSHPADIMKEMLRRRHMAPIYGDRTALAPEQKDYLVIDRIPNIFVTGHVHACAISEYRGIKLINASAWQSQTAFQRMHNQVPDPAKVPMVNLGTGDAWIEDFSE
jgi:DNA polymerase II small subunit